MNFKNFFHSKISITLSVSELLRIEDAINCYIDEKNNKELNGIFSKFSDLKLEKVIQFKTELSSLLSNEPIYQKAAKEKLGEDFFDEEILSSLTGINEILTEKLEENITLSTRMENILTILSITDYYIEENEIREYRNAPNDWLPPESLQYGTEDEREIWKSYYGK